MLFLRHYFDGARGSKLVMIKVSEFSSEEKTFAGRRRAAAVEKLQLLLGRLRII
jgi:hypothetical protein